jgi:hypothetical protein
MNRFIILVCILSLQACALSSKPIDYREVQNSRPKNRLLLGNDWNNIDVSYAERIKPIKYRRWDWFYDRFVGDTK